MSRNCSFNFGFWSGETAFRATASLHSPFSHDVQHPPSSSPLAPFRLLTLADPQLEGDTSIPTVYIGEAFPHLWTTIRHLTFQTEHYSLRWRVRQILHDIIDIFFEDIPNTIESVRKRIDHFGNDFYLAHIYRTVHWWTRPTHVTVLGDLVGSQWIDDKEFDLRSRRYWKRVFRGAERVPDEVARTPAQEYDVSGLLATVPNNETEVWERRIINVAGNHDIGYAGDINDERFERFERAFGKANYELRFELPVTDALANATIYNEVTNRGSDRLVPELRLIVLNDMNLDTPASSTELQDVTYSFINSVINTATAVEFKGHSTIILTHIPLYKPEGVCVDSPFFDFHEHDGTLKEQNQLSVDASRGFLEGIYGMSGNVNAPASGRGRPGLILNGHDHEGCDTYHFINQTEVEENRTWEVRRWRQAKMTDFVGKKELPGIREITVRSMMGDFGGNAGLVSAWFDYDEWQWRFEYATCPLGTQHLWWLVHTLDLITVGAILATVVLSVLSSAGIDLDKILVKQPAKNVVVEAKVLKTESKKGEGQKKS
ncbi:hypothetical protein DL546_004356 [Coniochaeta pulveracea]|uniref:Calcineurin-like phosphoesterase domain-containing protein n=1 Tax=Coniochaeta pulveracea TaxID=177199 RepID=A0A420Y777_9PEZI|nr:hypothetical protein DL546_004356 [Coniochaeta pulveracea]